MMDKWEELEEEMDMLEEVRKAEADIYHSKKRCYQCDVKTLWLAPDSRCGACTRFTPDEIRGGE